VIPAGYHRTTYQTAEYTRESFGRHLEVIELVPAGAGHLEDLVVARKAP
jgi:hypothetical protein